MESILLNPGPVSSFNSLVYYIGPQLNTVRKQFLQGSTPNVILDLRHLNPGNINIATIAALLSTCHKLSLFLGSPIETFISLNPYVQSFLNHIGFFSIAQKLSILDWDSRTVGGFWPIGMNPHTKILYFSDVVEPDVQLSDIEIAKLKITKKQLIGPNFSLRCSRIFNGLDAQLESTVMNTSLELITNCLIHARDYAFVAIQGTSNRISISVCDSGLGFKKSLSNNYPDCQIFAEASNIQAIVIGSLIQEFQHGLRLAIGHILNYESYPYDQRNYGWVTVSSFNSEIRWQKVNWDKAIEYYTENDIYSKLPDITTVLGNELKGFIPYESVEQGYWRNYKNRLNGTRISFEIPLYI